MKKYEMIKKNKEFNEIISTGKKFRTKNFSIYSLSSEYYQPKFGLAVSKKSGDAHIRNKLKRITRNLIDENKNLFKNNQNYIIMIKSSCLLEQYYDLNNELNILIKEINKKNE